MQLCIRINAYFLFPCKKFFNYIGAILKKTLHWTLGYCSTWFIITVGELHYQSLVVALWIRNISLHLDLECFDSKNRLCPFYSHRLGSWAMSWRPDTRKWCSSSRDSARLMRRTLPFRISWMIWYDVYILWRIHNYKPNLQPANTLQLILLFYSSVV